MDDGAMNEYLYNNKGGTFAPDFDLFIWDWSGDIDPDFMLAAFTHRPDRDWSDCAWSNAEYDKLYEEQVDDIDPAQRKDLI